MRQFILVIISLFLLGSQSSGQGYWVTLHNPPPDHFNGVSFLLPDGSVMVKACPGGNDSLGKYWDKLTPDVNGSYINGTWSRLDSSHYTRLYCSSQVLPDGRVYVAGGEFGTGYDKGEIYDAIADTWSTVGPLPSGYEILDGNSQLLPDGKILQNIVLPNSIENVIFDPATKVYTSVPNSHGGADESAWLELPDNSILFVDIGTRLSERYIPALNQWLVDDSVPVSLYDTYGDEEGAAFMLPDGRAFYIGSPSTTSYYTPSGDTTPGVWTAGPPIPDSLGAPDAAAAMMPNGKILCAFSKQPYLHNEYPVPTSFYEFDYTTNAFTEVSAPTGGNTMPIMAYQTGMLDLPDGNILMGILDSTQMYVYVPGGTPLAAGQPVVSNIFNNHCDTFMATGTLFNGISQGASYGDDWQMPTNFPVIRLINHSSLYGDFAYYARSFNWNRTGVVMTGNLPDTTYFTLPAGLPDETFDLVVVANGISSAPVTFTPCSTTGVAQVGKVINNLLEVYPNPASGQATVVFNASGSGSYTVKVIDVLGRTETSVPGETTAGKNNLSLQLGDIRPGIYSVALEDADGVYQAKLSVE